VFIFFSFHRIDVKKLNVMEVMDAGESLLLPINLEVAKERGGREEVLLSRLRRREP